MPPDPSIYRIVNPEHLIPPPVSNIPSDEEKFNQ
jgi:hypothetical protein